VTSKINLFFLNFIQRIPKMRPEASEDEVRYSGRKLIAAKYQGVWHSDREQHLPKCILTGYFAPTTHLRVVGSFLNYILARIMPG